MFFLLIYSCTFRFISLILFSSFFVQKKQNEKLEHYQKNLKHSPFVRCRFIYYDILRRRAKKYKCPSCNKICGLVEQFVSIIDDDVDITNLFYEVLRNIREIKPFKFTDPKIALQHFKDNVSSYKVVISDLKMPEMNGIELLKILKDLKPSLGTVLITAFEVNDKIFEEHKRNKIIDVMLQKPIKIQELSKQISLLIEELPRQTESPRIPMLNE